RSFHNVARAVRRIKLRADRVAGSLVPKRIGQFFPAIRVKTESAEESSFAPTFPVAQQVIDNFGSFDMQSITFRQIDGRRAMFHADRLPRHRGAKQSAFAASMVGKWCLSERRSPQSAGRIRSSSAARRLAGRVR